MVRETTELQTTMTVDLSWLMVAELYTTSEPKVGLVLIFFLSHLHKLEHRRKRMLIK